MSGMQDEFQAGLERAFRKAAKHRSVIAKIKKNADKNPERLAAWIVEVVADHLRETRTAVLEAFGLDLTDAEAIRNYQASSVGEWQIISWLATRHLIYSSFLRLIVQYAQDPNLTGVRSARAVCEAFVEATDQHLCTVASDSEELHKRLPRERFPKEELAKVLSGMIATRISLHSNPPLRAAIDERREHSRGKSIKRERFEQLLKELPAQVLDVWEETAHQSRSLSEIRTKVARQLDNRSSKPPPEVELATFIERESIDSEKLLKRAKDAGLPPREYELYKLRVVENYGMPLREAAQYMGIAEGTAKSLWSRIKRTIGPV